MRGRGRPSKNNSRRGLHLRTKNHEITSMTEENVSIPIKETFSENSSFVINNETPRRILYPSIHEHINNEENETKKFMTLVTEKQEPATSTPKKEYSNDQPSTEFIRSRSSRRKSLTGRKKRSSLREWYIKKSEGRKEQMLKKYHSQPADRKELTLERMRENRKSYYSKIKPQKKKTILENISHVALKRYHSLPSLDSFIYRNREGERFLKRYREMPNPAKKNYVLKIKEAALNKYYKLSAGFYKKRLKRKKEIHHNKSAMERQKYLQRRRTKYSVMATIQGVAFLFAIPDNQKITEKKLKNQLLRLISLTKSNIALMNSTKNTRHESLKHMINPNTSKSKIPKNIKKFLSAEAYFKQEFHKEIDKSTNDIELSKGLSALGFVADHYVRYSMDADDVGSFSDVLSTITDCYTKGLDMYDIVLEEMNSLKEKFIRAVNKKVIRHVEENERDYEQRRVGNFKYHLKSKDGKNSIEYNYRSMSDTFQEIYDDFMGVHVKTKNESFICVPEDSINYHEREMDCSTAKHPNHHDEVMKLANEIFNEETGEIVITPMFPNISKEEEANIITETIEQAEVLDVRMEAAAAEEMHNLALDENDMENLNGYAAPEAAKHVLGAIKSTETLIRFCDCKCFVPPNDWAITIRTVINSFKNLANFNFIEAILNFDKCQRTCCTKQIKTMNYEGCENYHKLLTQLEPCYSNIRSILRRYREIKSCCLWLNAWQESVMSKNSLLMRNLVNSPFLSKSLKNKIPSNISNTDIHSESKVKEKFGKFIDGCKKQFSENEDQGCVICRRLHVKKNIRKITIETVLNNFPNALPADCLLLSQADQIDICCSGIDSCLTAIKKKKMPQMAVNNNMGSDPIPDELKNLNWIEKMCIKLVKPCQATVTLKPVMNHFSTSIKAAEGGVIYMPVPVEETINHVIGSLPNDSNLLILVKNISKTKAIKFTICSVPKMLAALRWLQANNELYRNILLNVNFEINGDRIIVENGGIIENIQTKDPQESKHILSLNVTHQGTTDVNPKHPDGTSMEQFYLKEFKGDPIGFNTPNLDVKSFPELFPTSNFGKDALRQIKISDVKYHRSRLRNIDRRWVEDPAYLFHVAFFMDMKVLIGSINHALRRTTLTDERTIVENILNKDPQLEDDLITQCSQLRSHEGFWKLRRLELHSMINIFGTPTWFFTLNPAEWSELHWPEVFETYRIVHNIPLGTPLKMNDLIIKDSALFARLFHQRVKSFLKLIKSIYGPLGIVIEYFYRIEYQARGAPHVHGLFWVDGAPVIGVNTIEELIAFLDEYLTCRIPSKDEPDLLKLVNDFQRHRPECSSTCKRFYRIGHKKIPFCRFGFPREPTKSTILVSENQEYQGVPGLRGKCYCLKRTSEESYINDYNPAMLMAWKANVDLQFVSNENSSMIFYVTGYTAKSEKNEIKNEDQVIYAANTNEKRKALLSFEMKQLWKRTQGTIEVCDRIFGHEAYRFSKNVVFLNTNAPDKRTRSIKPPNILKEDLKRNPNASPYYSNYPDVYYPIRPKELEEFSYFNLFTYFEVKNKNANSKKDKEEELESDCQSDTEELPNDTDNEMKNRLYGSDPYSKAGYHTKEKDSPFYKHPVKRVFPFKTPSGEEKFFVTRMKPIVPRLYFPFFDENDDLSIDDFYRRSLMLFRPWRNENLLKGKCESFIEAFSEYMTDDSISKNAKDDITKLLESYQKMLRKRDEHVKKLNELREKTMALADIQEVEEDIDIPIIEVNVKEHYERVNRLNKIQKMLFYKIINAIRHQNGMDCHQKYCEYCNLNEMVGQKLFFISGEGGTGKSELIKCIVEELHLMFPNDHKNGHLRSAVAAPTGMAAKGIGGHTIHNLFALLVKHGGEAGYEALTEPRLSELKKMFSKLPLIILDEVSMISNILLIKLHMRCCELTGIRDVPFGGLNVIILGDFMQLPPVRACPVFQIIPQSGITKFFGSSLTSFNLWHDVFEYYELKENMRQKTDTRFADMMKRIRFGSPTDDDIKLLLTRMITVLDGSHSNNDQGIPPSATLQQAAKYFMGLIRKNPKAIAVFPKNDEADLFNEEVTKLALEENKQELVTIDCIDNRFQRKKGRTREVLQRQFLPTNDPYNQPKPRDDSKNYNPGKAGGLHRTLKLFIGCRVMLRRNISISRGLVNGSLGEIKSFSYDSNNLIDGIYVKFDDLDHEVKIEKQTAVFKVAPNVERTRRQFPLSVAYGITIHKCQGVTCQDVVAKLDETFADGQAYVALSRSTTLNGIHLIAFHTDSIKCPLKCYMEYQRLRSTRDMSPLPKPNVKPKISATFPKKMKAVAIVESVTDKKTETKERKSRKDNINKKHVNIINSNISTGIQEKLYFVTGNLLNLPVECIANAAKPELNGGGGIDGIIHSAAGPELLKECSKFGGCNVGEARITKAYNITIKNPSIKAIIHAVGPDVRQRKRKLPLKEDKENLRSSYINALNLVVNNGYKAIAFPCISTGIYSFPPAEASRLVLKEVQEWLQDDHNFGSIEKIVFCVYPTDQKNIHAYQKIFSTMPLAKIVSEQSFMSSVQIKTQLKSSILNEISNHKVPKIQPLYPNNENMQVNNLQHCPVSTLRFLNHGSNCFENATIKVLSILPLLAEKITSYISTNENNENEVARRFLSYIFRIKQGLKSLQELLKLNIFAGLQRGQQDAQEFMCLRLMPNVFTDEWKDLFMLNTITWSVCECGFNTNPVVRPDLFITLGLRRLANQNNNVNFADLLHHESNEHVSERMIDYICPNCSNQNSIQNTRYNFDTNKYLILVMNIGQHDIYNRTFVRDDVNVLNFHQDNLRIGGYNWSAVGIIVHIPYEGNLGHYYSLCRRPNTPWFQFNDSNYPILSDIPQNLIGCYIIILEKIALELISVPQVPREDELQQDTSFSVSDEESSIKEPEKKQQKILNYSQNETFGEIIPDVDDSAPEWFTRILNSGPLPYKPLGPYHPKFSRPLPPIENFNQFCLFITMEKSPAVARITQNSVIECLAPVIKSSKDHNAEVLFHSGCIARGSHDKKVKIYQVQCQPIKTIIEGWLLLAIYIWCVTNNQIFEGRKFNMIDFNVFNEPSIVLSDLMIKIYENSTNYVSKLSSSHSEINLICFCKKPKIEMSKKRKNFLYIHYLTCVMCKRDFCAYCVMWDEKSKLVCLSCKILLPDTRLNAKDRMKELPLYGGSMNGLNMIHTCPVDSFLSIFYYHMWTYDINYYNRIMLTNNPYRILESRLHQILKQSTNQNFDIQSAKNLFIEALNPKITDNEYNVEGDEFDMIHNVLSKTSFGIDFEIQCRECKSMHILTEDLLILTKRCSTMQECYDYIFHDEHMKHKSFLCNTCKMQSCSYIPGTKRHHARQPFYIAISCPRVRSAIHLEDILDLPPALLLKRWTYRLGGITFYHPGSPVGHYTSLIAIKNGGWVYYDGLIGTLPEVVSLRSVILRMKRENRWISCLYYFPM